MKMDVFRDPLLEKQLESLSSQLLNKISATKVTAGKENICPQESTELLAAASIGDSRSPLPQGFPRVALQDITDALSPFNNGGPVSQSRNKETRDENSTLNPSSNTKCGSSTWEGLTKCSKVGMAKMEIRAESEAAVSEPDEKKALEEKELSIEEACASKRAGVKANSETGSLERTRNQKRQRQSRINAMAAESKGRSSVMNFR